MCIPAKNMIPRLSKYLCNIHSVQIFHIPSEMNSTPPICHFLAYLLKYSSISSETSGMY